MHRSNREQPPDQEDTPFTGIVRLYPSRRYNNGAADATATATAVVTTPSLSSPLVSIFVVVATIVNFVARSTVTIVVVFVVITCHHFCRHPIPLRRRPSCRRHQPSPAAVLSITFVAPVDDWLLRSPPAQQHTN